MTYGRRHYLTQQVLVRLAYAGPTSGETREFLKASLRFVLAITLIFFGLAGLSAGAELGQGDTGVVGPQTATTGEFLYRSGSEASYDAAPTVDTRVRFDVTGLFFRTATVYMEARGMNGNTDFEAWSPLYGGLVLGPVSGGFDYQAGAFDWTGFVNPGDDPGLTALRITPVNGSLALHSIELCLE